MMATLPGGADIPGGTAHVALIVCLPLVEMDDGRMKRANSPDHKPTADLWITHGSTQSCGQIVTSVAGGFYTRGRGTRCSFGAMNPTPRTLDVCVDVAAFVLLYSMTLVTRSGSGLPAW
jgi:hypothetical protein